MNETRGKRKGCVRSAAARAQQKGAGEGDGEFEVLVWVKGSCSLPNMDAAV